MINVDGFKGCCVVCEDDAGFLRNIDEAHWGAQDA